MNDTTWMPITKAEQEMTMASVKLEKLKQAHKVITALKMEWNAFLKDKVKNMNFVQRHFLPLDDDWKESVIFEFAARYAE